ARIISELIADIFPPEYVTIVEGDRETAEALLLEKFDTIFFTGSTRVGKSVLAAAARHLTPVTLELGGKCPAIVCADAPLEVTARRIAWGKFMNAGQTCVAPDFILVERQVFQPLVETIQRVIREFYGELPQTSPNYGRIVNRSHFDRLIRIAGACQHDAEDLYIAPTLLTGVSWDAPVMQEEIFGPILPVIPFDSIDEVPALLLVRPAPLALYLFTNDRAVQDRIVSGTRSGGVCINDTVVHMVGQDLPFGGVGESGMGQYHGKAGFDCFSHQRTVVRRSTSPDFRFRYPPPKLSLAKLKKACRFLLGS
ncbi:MAG: aldehyde dehydrogenase family protein, partial [Verrucomicrobiota bacterium]